MRAREFIIDESLDEGIKSALAGAALAGTIAVGTPVAKADDYKQQIIAAVKSNKIPMPRDYAIVIKSRGGIALEVEIDGQTHDMPLTQTQRSHLAQIDQIRDRMNR
jgi:hypothetical protein